MILGLYVVKDELANHYFNPTPFLSKEEAERQFKTNVNNIELWKNNASDFSLFKVGEYNEETGEIIPVIEKIGSGHSYLN